MNSQASVKVWDLGVRIFHWSLVFFFAFSFISGEWDDELWHVYASYVVCGLILFRIVWGFVGSEYARFSNFIYSPGEVIDYLKSLLNKPKHYLGHNPAGGLMVILLLVNLVISCWTGLVLYGKEGHGPLAGADVSVISQAVADDDDRYERRGHREEGDEDEFWEEVHEVATHLNLILVFIHILGVIVSSRLHNEKLVKAMITGRKEKPTEG